MQIFASRAFVGDRWAQNTRVTLSDGLIADVTSGVTPNAEDHRVDTLLPAMCNLHSHSFQRAMAGRTEFRAQGRESFWTWRDLMYRFVEKLTPELVGAIAELAFMEMLKSGYAAVGEFHYLHHQPGGTPYDNLAELSVRLMQAATDTGIGLTHLPVLYSYGDVMQAPVAGGQHRFYNDINRFQRLVEACQGSARNLPADIKVGIAPHSLRAVSPHDLTILANAHPETPIHIHIAEQINEVERVKAGLGARPVEWLLNNSDVNRFWCLIHATHMTKTETENLAATGAVVGLCPVTEANLGDGIFNGYDYLNTGGDFGVGTDSNVNISLSEELRMLEYSQRLRDRQRNVMVKTKGSTGSKLYRKALRGGAQALARNSGEIAVDKLADLVAIDTTDPRMFALADDQVFDGFIFAASDNVVMDVWSAGRHQVCAGRHVNEDAIKSRYQSAIQTLIKEF